MARKGYRWDPSLLSERPHEALAAAEQLRDPGGVDGDRIGHSVVVQDRRERPQAGGLEGCLVESFIVALLGGFIAVLLAMIAARREDRHRFDDEKRKLYTAYMEALREVLHRANVSPSTDAIPAFEALAPVGQLEVEIALVAPERVRQTANEAHRATVVLAVASGRRHAAHEDRTDIPEAHVSWMAAFNGHQIAVEQFGREAQYDLGVLGLKRTKAIRHLWRWIQGPIEV